MRAREAHVQGCARIGFLSMMLIRPRRCTHIQHLYNNWPPLFEVDRDGPLSDRMPLILTRWATVGLEASMWASISPNTLIVPHIGPQRIDSLTSDLSA